MALLIVATLLKIGFVLAVIGGITPVLTWAERRQSAMMQDRVGPVRAGVPLPKSIANFIRGPMALGAKIVGYLSLGLAVIAVLISVYLMMARGQMHDQMAAIAEHPDQREAIVASMREQAASQGLLTGASGAELDSQLAEAADSPGALVALVDASVDSALTFYGWLAVVLVLIGLFHFVASSAVRGAVDKRGHLTVYGLLHPLADVVKLIWKEDFTPPKADKFLYSAAPIIALIPAFATFAVIPFGPELHWGPPDAPFAYLFSVVPYGAAENFGRIIPLQVASINIGILYIFAIAGTGIVGAAIAGYSSDNKFSLLGGLRAASQMVSYEVTLGLTLVGSFMVYNTLLIGDMVRWQQDNVWGFVVQPLALILFFFASIAEMKRVPFDAPEGESEIVAGYFTEYSGMKFGMFMTGEFVEHIVTSGIIVTLFFGGHDVPFLEVDGFHLGWLGLGTIHMPHILVILLSVLAFVLKICVVCFLQLQVRWTLPRFRYDQTMALCWKIILPLSLANILITGIVILAFG